MAPPSTRDRILDEAERLFAERGLAGVSLREIGMAADQRNNGAVQYHFGDKEGLVRSVFSRRAVPIDQRRMELLDACVTGRFALTDVIDAYITPLADQVVALNWYVPFLSRLQSEHRRDELLEPASASFNLAYHRTSKLLQTEFLSDLPTKTFAVRWRLAVNLVIDALADHQLGTRRISTRRFQHELVDAVAGLLAGPFRET